MLRKGEVVFTGKINDLLHAQQPIIIAKGQNESDLNTLLTIAKSAGHHATIRDGALHVEGPKEWAAILNKAAFDAGITLSQLTPQLPNLEETFFEMTGEK
jgi:ABC-2 type transport system ATP-binding protein